MIHMHQRRVIAGLHVDLRLLLDAIIDDNIQCVAISNRGNGAISAVSEQLSDFVFAGQVNIVTELHSQFRQADVVRCRKDCEYVAAFVAQHDALGQTIAGDLAELGGVHRRHGKLDGEWRDCVVVELLIDEAHQ